MSQSKSYKKKNKSRTSAARKQILPLALGLLGLFLLGLAAIVILGGNGFGAKKTQPEGSGAPKLKVDQEVVDLGDVKLGKTVQVSFELSNAGDQPLRFSEAPYIEVVEGC